MGTEAGWHTRRKNKSEYEAALCEKAERCGEQRAVDGIVRWIAKRANGWTSVSIALAIERGEWKEGK